MRTLVLVGVAALVGVMALALPTMSQEQTRIGAMVDVTVLANKLDTIAKTVVELKKENEELKKTIEKGNDLLEVIAAGVGILRVPVRWEYKFYKSRSEKLANKLGSEGWELSNIYDNDWFVYRRPLPPKGVAAEEANE